MYGPDGRAEYFSTTSAIGRDLTAGSMVALIRRSYVTSDAALTTAVLTAGQAFGLCEGEAFEDQPAAAFCSGVIVDWDLILTAAHCTRVYALGDISVVAGYYYSGPGQLAMGPEDMLEPIEIVSERLDPSGSSPREDFAWLRLDRPVSPPRRPVPIALGAAAVETAAPLVSVSAGLGVPMKVDDGASVVDARTGTRDYFVADSDTSAGSSGGGAFDERGALLGILARGAADFVETEEGCKGGVHSERAHAAEAYTYAARAVAGLCETDPAASTLCRHDCGDPCEALAPDAALLRDGSCAHASPPQDGWALLLVLVAISAGARSRRKRSPGRGTAR